MRKGFYGGGGGRGTLHRVSPSLTAAASLLAACGVKLPVCCRFGSMKYLLGEPVAQGESTRPRQQELSTVERYDHQMDG